ncbi:glutaredoxin, partial [Candidatus Woesearchaeota archaeon]|nr:glutaredoxin [Candidatus Woesearchaeota archaeon]
MQKEKYVLFRLEGCPYCRRAEEFLDKRGIKYRK